MNEKMDHETAGAVRTSVSVFSFDARLIGLVMGIVAESFDRIGEMIMYVFLARAIRSSDSQTICTNFIFFFGNGTIEKRAICETQALTRNDWLQFSPLRDLTEPYAQCAPHAG